MPTITTQTLINRARAISDMHDGFITDSEWMAWATQERLALDLFIARSGWTQNFSTLTITVTGSESGVFTLSSPVLAIVSVHEKNAAGMVRPVEFNNVVDFYRQIDGSTQNTGHPKYYRVKTSGDTVSINFWPTPVASYAFVVTYIPHPNTLDLIFGTNIDANVTYPMGWEERIVLGMAKRALIKEESDFSAIQRLIQEIESQIEELCFAKVLSDTPSIRNIDLERRGWTDRLLFPPWQQWAWI